MINYKIVDAFEKDEDGILAFIGELTIFFEEVRALPSAEPQKTMSVAEFRANTAQRLKRAHDAEEPTAITKHGKPYATVIGPQSALRLDRWDTMLTKFNALTGLTDEPTTPAGKEVIQYELIRFLEQCNSQPETP